MKRIVLAVAMLALGVGGALAQQQEIPKPKCEPKPQLPGQMMRQDTMSMRRFNQDVKNYKDCIMAYVEERRKVSQANTDAGNAAIEEYNQLMKELNEQNQK